MDVTDAQFRNRLDNEQRTYVDKDGNTYVRVSAVTQSPDGTYPEIRSTGVDPNNTTSTPLGSSGVFTGTATDVSGYTTVTTSIYTDQNSVVEGIQCQFSSDGVNWDDSNNFTKTGGVARRFEFPVTAKYYRIVYTNGTTAQTELRIQTILHTNSALTSIHRIGDNIDADRSATLTKATMLGRNQDNPNEYIDALVSPQRGLVVTPAEAHQDLFGRLVTEEPTPLWTYENRYDLDDQDYWDFEASNGGTNTHNSDRVVRVITNSQADTDYVKYRTLRYFEYHKGRQQSFTFTGNLKGATANVSKKIGCFDDDNGAYIELDNGTPYVCIRSSTSGSVVNTRVAQSSWNIDTMDGNGDSGITLDWDNYQIFYIEYAWLGTNAVEFGTFKDGKKIAFHRSDFSNTQTTAWSQSGNLPFGLEMVNQAALGAAPTMEFSCIAVNSGGKLDQDGHNHVVSTGTTEVTVSTTASVIAAIRMASTTSQGSLKPVDFQLLSPSGNSTIYYEISIGGTITGGTWNDITDSIAESVSAPTSFTTGHIIKAGYVKAGGETSLVQDINGDLYAGRYLDGTGQILMITAQTVSSTSKLLFSGTFREYK